MKRWVLAVAGLLAGCTQAADRWQPIMAGPQVDASNMARMRTASAQVLFWSQAERDANFPHMEDGFAGHVVRARGPARPLPNGAPLNMDAADVDSWMDEHNTAGLIVVQDGKVRLERYKRGLTPTGRWTSFSVAKSFTSTLVGAAIKDGYITSVADPVTKYIPELSGSGYDGVTIRQLLTMTSGVKWNEDYTDPNSDVARMFTVPVPAGQDATVAYMRTLPRADPPGSKWVYKTGETNLIGVLVHRATGKPLANYLSEKVFGPAGMEADGFWMVDEGLQEVAGCCLSVRLRDYARMGLFALDGGKGVVPADWFADATSAHASTGGAPGFGYGYQWWTYPDERFGGVGIFGQSITVDRKSRAVVVMLSAWPKATDRAQSQARYAFQERLFKAL